MSTITVTHAPSGLVHAHVARTERVTPHMVRVTLAGDDLRRFEYRGFDQWFRLAVPVDDHARFDNLPERFDTRSYLRYLVLPKATRPAIRNYTVRAFRRDVLELDVDFVCHGAAGVAGPWAEAVEPGAEVAFIDQGCGWAPVPADWNLLVADESGLAAVAGILRDLPRDAVGHAIIELIDAADAQPVDAPDGVRVHWVPRAAGGSGRRPGDGTSEVDRLARRHPVRVRRGRVEARNRSQAIPGHRARGTEEEHHLLRLLEGDIGSARESSAWVEPAPQCAPPDSNHRRSTGLTATARPAPS